MCKTTGFVISGTIKSKFLITDVSSSWICPVSGDTPRVPRHTYPGGLLKTVRAICNVVISLRRSRCSLSL
jgi:hypothetical protein